MAKEKEWRLIEFECLDAYTNMAMDEAIFVEREIGSSGYPSILWLETRGWNYRR